MATENKWYKKQDELLKKEPAAYDESVLGEPLRQMADNIVNRKPFSYDFATDPTYQQHEDRYIRAGKQAMRDTQGQAAQLSGGYGNSYAASAGQQAYQDYVSKLTAMIPQLYEAAFNRYQTDLAGQRADYAMMADREAQAYARGQDARNNWLQQLSLYGDMGNQERAFDYQKGRDAVADKQWQSTFDYQKGRDKVSDSQWQQQFNENVRQFGLEYALRQAAANGSTGGGAGNGGGGQKQPVKKVDNNPLNGVSASIKNEIMKMMNEGKPLSDAEKRLKQLVAFGSLTRDQADALYDAYASGSETYSKPELTAADALLALQEATGKIPPKNNGNKVNRITTADEAKAATGKMPNITSKSQFKKDPIASATYASFEDYLTDWVRRNS